MADMTLKALLLGDDKSMSKSFKGAEKSAQGASKGIKGHFGGMKKALAGDFTSLGASMAGGLGKIGPMGAAAGAAIGGLAIGLGTAVKFGKESIDAFKNVAGQTLKLQRIMGGTAEEASRMRFAFQQTGIDGDTAAKALGIFSKNIVNMKPATKELTRHVEVATGAWKKQTTIVKDASGHFQKLERMVPVMKMKTLHQTIQTANPTLAMLGITAKDATGHIRPMADLLPEIADKFKTMPAGAEKSALALKLFGKGGLALLPFLNKGAAGIQELMEKSDKFGLTLSGKDLDALKASKAAHRDWDAAMEGAKVRMGAQLLPMVTKLVTYFQAKMIPIIVSAGKWVADHREQISKTAKAIGTATVTMIKMWVAWEKGVLTVVRGVAAGFIWLWNGILAPTIRFILNGFATLSTSIGLFLVALGRIPGFGWAKDAGVKMLGAASAARALARDIKNIPTTKTVTVNTYFRTHGNPNPLAAVGSGAGVKGYASGTSNATAGWHWVGENGPELMRLSGGEQIMNARDSARAAASGSGGVARLEVVVKNEDGRVLQRRLLDLKRQTGINLGLA